MHESRTILDGTTERWEAMAEAIERDKILLESIQQNSVPSELSSLYRTVEQQAIDAAALREAGEKRFAERVAESTARIDEQKAAINALAIASAAGKGASGGQGLSSLYLSPDQRAQNAAALAAADQERYLKKLEEIQDNVDIWKEKQLALNQAIAEGQPSGSLTSLYLTPLEQYSNAQALVIADEERFQAEVDASTKRIDERRKAIDRMADITADAIAATADTTGTGLSSLYLSPTEQEINSTYLLTQERERLAEITQKAADAEEFFTKAKVAAAALETDPALAAPSSLYRTDAQKAADNADLIAASNEAIADAEKKAADEAEKAQEAIDKLAESYRDKLIPSIDGASKELRDFVGVGADATDILGAMGGEIDDAVRAADRLTSAASALDAWASSFDDITAAGDEALGLVDELIGTQEDRNAAAIESAETERDYIEQTHDIEKGYRDELKDLNRQYSSDIKDEAKSRVDAEKEGIRELKDLEKQRAEIALSTEEQLADLAAQRTDISRTAAEELASAETDYHATLQDNIAAQKELRVNLQSQTQDAAESWNRMLRDQKEELQEIKADLRQAQSDLGREFLRDEQDIGIRLKRLNEDYAADMSQADLSPEDRAKIELDYRRDIEDLMLGQSRTQEDYYRETKEKREEAKSDEQDLIQERRDAEEDYHERISDLKADAHAETMKIADQEREAAQAFADEQAQTRADAAEEQARLDGEYQQILEDQGTAYSEIESEKRLAARDSAIEQRELARETADIEKAYRKDVAAAEAEHSENMADANNSYADALANMADEQTLLDKALTDGTITQAEYNLAMSEGTAIQNAAKDAESLRTAALIRDLPTVRKEYDLFKDSFAEIMAMPEGEQERALWWLNEENRAKAATAASLLYDQQLDKLPPEVVTRIVAEIDDPILREIVDEMLPTIAAGATAPIGVVKETGFDTAKIDIDAAIAETTAPKETTVTVAKSETFDEDVTTIKDSLATFTETPIVANIDGDFTQFVASFTEAERLGGVWAAKVFSATITANTTELDTIIAELQEELDGKSIAKAYVDIEGRRVREDSDASPAPPKTEKVRSEPGAMAHGGHGSGYFWAGEHEPELIHAPNGAYVLSGSASVSKVQAVGRRGGGSVDRRNRMDYKDWFREQPAAAKDFLRDIEEITKREMSGLARGNLVLTKKGNIVKRGSTQASRQGVFGRRPSRGGRGDESVMAKPADTSLPESEFYIEPYTADTGPFYSGQFGYGDIAQSLQPQGIEYGGSSSASTEALHRQIAALAATVAQLAAQKPFVNNGIMNTTNSPTASSRAIQRQAATAQRV
jgi:hypothetical protein